MEKIKTLSLDLETYSSVSLKKAGVYPYAESPDFEILLFGYSVNGGPVHVVDIACGEQIPEPVLSALTDDTVIKWAFNASFERICLSYWLQRHHPEHFKSYSIPEDSVRNYLNPEAWRCSMVWSAYMGLPLSLEGAGAVLKLDAQKLSEGKDLIRYFCVPCAPTKANGGRTRNLPAHAPDKWTLFKKYNQRDVEVEMAIQQRLHRYPVPDFVWEEYHLDQEINDRGIAIDMGVVENAIRLDKRSKAELSDKMKSCTSLENPNSVMQLKAWLSEHGMETDSLGKKTVVSMLKDAPADLRKVLELRLQLSKAALKNTQPCRTPYVPMVVPGVCFSFMELIAAVVGRGVIFNYRTCLRTTCRTWRKPALL